jgi:hypothetical protein
MLKKEIKESIQKAYKDIRKKYPDIQLSRISTDRGKIWVNIAVPDSLIDNEELENFLSGIGTDLVLSTNTLIFFDPVVKENKVA